MLPVRNVCLERSRLEFGRQDGRQPPHRGWIQNVVEPLSESTPQLEAMMRRLRLKNHLELAVAIAENVRLEHLRQFNLVLAEPSLRILESIVSNHSFRIYTVRNN